MNIVATITSSHVWEYGSRNEGIIGKNGQHSIWAAIFPNGTDWILND